MKDDAPPSHPRHDDASPRRHHHDRAEKGPVRGSHVLAGVTSLRAPVNVYLATIDPMMFDELSVLWIEVSDEALAKGSVDESVVEINGRFTVSGIAELEELLVGLGVAPGALALKEDTGYPL